MPYRQQHDLLNDLVNNDHVALDDEPLLLAIYYDSKDAPDEECLFEVARNFGYGEPSDDKHIFQIQFGRTTNFNLPVGGRLRLSLTNPNELRRAVEEGWPEVVDLRDAISRGQYELLYQRPGDHEAQELEALLIPQGVPA